LNFFIGKYRNKMNKIDEKDSRSNIFRHFGTVNFFV